MNNLPINIQINNARIKFHKTLSEITMEYGLPAFIVSGIIADLMLEVKMQEKVELSNSFNEISSTLQQETETLNEEIKSLRRELEK